MKLTRYFRLIAAIFCLPFLALSCSQGGDSSTETAASTAGPVSIDLSESYSYEVNFGSASTLEATVSGLKGSTLLLAKINLSAKSVPAEATGTVRLTTASSSKAITSDDATLQYFGETPTAPTRPPRLPHPLAEATRLKGTGKTGSSVSPLTSRRSSTAVSTISYGESSTSYVEGTTQEKFWVEYYNASGSLAGFDTVTATLKKVTDHAYIWVADSESTDNAEATSSFDISTELEDSKVTLLADAFEDVVFPEDTAIFGYERGGGTGGDGGIDGDQHISILLFDIAFDNNASSDGYIAGYFWSKDDADYSTSDVYASEGDYPSNGKEMFYLDAKALDKSPYTIVSTLAHEYQHMINYNMEEYRGRTQASTWLDEFRSLSAEDLLSTAFTEFSEANPVTGIDTYNYFTDGPGSWAQYFNSYYRYAGLGYWSSTMYDYMYASVFGAYLLRSYGGVAFMDDCVTHANSGESMDASFADAVSDAAKRTTDGTAIDPYACTSVSSSDFFASILPDYVRALYGFGADGTADNSPFTRSDARAASETSSSSRSLSAYTIRDSSDKYTLKPSYYSASAKVSLLPHSFSIHSDTSLISMTSDSVTLTLTAPTNSNVSWLLIRIP